MDNAGKTESETIEVKEDFSGNYIEKFESNSEEDQYPGSFVSWDKQGEKFRFHADAASLEVGVITNDIIKFRYANDGYFDDDFSYVVAKELPFIAPTNFVEDEEKFVISTATVQCHITKANLSTSITDLNGNVIVEDEKGYHWKEERRFGGDVVISTKKISKDEKFYGLGDKTGSLNMLGSRYELWGTDCYGYGEETDPVYKNIPFYYGQHSKQGYGIFLDNTFRSFFDFGKERKKAMSLWAQGGELRYYFINGPKLIDVAKRYTNLTGVPELPPKWALGYHQSKWSYYPESTVRELAADFRDKQIPCDVIHLDIDYMDEFRCFTWDNDRFPDPAKLIKDLKTQGFKTVVILDPGIKIDKQYFVYNQAMENAYFCSRADGPLLKGSVWPGPCHFPDFTNPKVREWWASLFNDFLSSGIDGVWNDMNEPAVFEDGTFPFDARHDYDGHPSSHRKSHNVYGSLMAQSTYHGQKQVENNKRPFTITRSAYAGIQKYASVWTGDNVATWSHLKMANRQVQRLNISGVSFAGSDIGGFIGTPSGELYARWIQLGIFHPFCRTHSSGDHGDKEPWKFEKEIVDIVRYFIQLRYQLMPYLYSSFQQHIASGAPMIKPLSMVYQNDSEVWNREEEFILGDHLLVCPISDEGATQRNMYLPEGHWFDFWTDEQLKGKREIIVEAPLNRIPLFIEAGAVIPMQPTMNFVDEFEYEELTLHVYKTEHSKFSYLYEDAGDGFDYQGSGFRKSEFKADATDGYSLTQSIDGAYLPCYTHYKIELHGWKKGSVVINVDGQEQEYESDGNLQVFTTEINFKQIIIKES